MKMKKIILVNLLLTFSVISSWSQPKYQLALIKPTTPGNISAMIPLSEQELKDHNKIAEKLASSLVSTSMGAEDTLFRNYFGDTLGLARDDTGFVYFNPGAPCIIKAIGLYTQKWQPKFCHGFLVSINKTNWHADTPPDSFDAYGWAGWWNNQGNWQGSSWGFPLLGEMIWGEFPSTALDGQWMWTEMLWLGFEPDTKGEDFCIVIVPYGDHDAFLGLRAGDATEIPEHHFWRYYLPNNGKPGPDGEHYGWFRTHYGVAICLVVEFYQATNTPPSITQITQLSNTDSIGPFKVEATIQDDDSENPQNAGIESAYLAYSINGGVSYDSTQMAGPTNGGIFTGNIPALQPRTIVDYYISAFDLGGLYSASDVHSFKIVTDSLFTKVKTGEIVTDVASSSGCSWGDYDNNGFHDLFVANWDAHLDNFYRNKGNGTFQKIAGIFSGTNLYSTSSIWADFDNDKDLDLFITTLSGNNILYENSGDESFNKITNTIIASEGGNSRTSSWCDYDNDGNLDLFVSNRYGYDNFLYCNMGNGTFSKITEGAIVNDGGNSTGCCWGDYDNDGDMDLFVANASFEPNYLYQNRGNGLFDKINIGEIVTDVASSSGGCWGDYDNDGDLDLFVTNSGFQNNFLYVNNGDGTFYRKTDGIIVKDGGDSNGSSWIDFDNDGDLDLFVVNRNGEDNFFYSNNGDGTFTKIANSIVACDDGNSNGAAWCDVDNDGDLDLVVANSNQQNNFFYLNKGNENHWINFRLKGNISNSYGIGAKLRIMTMVNDKPVWQMQEISGQAYTSQNSINAEFGLGDATVIDSVLIYWPSKILQTLTNIGVDQFLVIEKPMPIALKVGSVTANPNDTVKVPIFAKFPTDAYFISTEISIGGYDQSLRFIAVETDSSLLGSAGWNYDIIDKDSSVQITAFAGWAITGEGILFWLKFQVLDVSSSFIPIEINSATFNNGEIPVVLKSGGVKIKLIANYGDVNLDGTVQASDALLILNYLLGLALFNDQQFLNADVTQDSTISALDAALILKYDAGIISSLPYDSTMGSLETSVNYNKNVEYVIQLGDTIPIFMNLYHVENLLSFEGCLHYEPEILTFLDMIWFESTANYELKTDIQSGIIKFAGAHHTSEIQADPFVQFRFRVTSKASTALVFEKLRWNEQSILYNEILGYLHCPFHAVTNEPEKSTDYVLSQNYPNPFNRSTAINYSLKQACHVQLLIYDEKGVLVQTLVNARQQEGCHTTYWNGKNNHEKSVASGIYFYKLITDNNTSFTRKMILVK